MLRLAGQHFLRPSILNAARHARNFRTTALRLKSGPTKLNNILEGGPTPPVQVRGVTPAGIELEDGLILPSACVFLDGNVFLWNVPQTLWSNWGKEHFSLFEVVVPKPGEQPSRKKDEGMACEGTCVRQRRETGRTAERSVLPLPISPALNSKLICDMPQIFPSQKRFIHVCLNLVSQQAWASCTD